MYDESITISPGDTFTVGTDEDGYPAIKIQNTVWIEPARRLRFGHHDGDQAARLNELIDALVELRDTEPKT